MDYLQHFPEAVFYLAFCGAGAAAVKHFLSPLKVIDDLTPVGVLRRGGDDADAKANADAATVVAFANPAVEWWGGIAFAIMNAGFFASGAHAAYTGSQQAKRGVLLGVAVLFDGFSLAWFTRGDMTRKRGGHVRQGVKVGLFGLLFTAAFAAMPAE